MMSPIQRINVDFTGEMLAELDEMALKMNISRQAFIKTSLRQILDHLAQRSRKAS
jgi:metal-responsive CopG/Arc/MetJ family transcriptional regulator